MEKYCKREIYSISHVIQNHEAVWKWQLLRDSQGVRGARIFNLEAI